jgi:hypothetical protein
MLEPPVRLELRIRKKNEDSQFTCKILQIAKTRRPNAMIPPFTSVSYIISCNIRLGWYDS